MKTRHVRNINIKNGSVRQGQNARGRSGKPASGKVPSGKAWNQSEYLTVPLSDGEEAILKQTAEANGMTVEQFIVRAVEDKIASVGRAAVAAPAAQDGPDRFIEFAEKLASVITPAAGYFAWIAEWVEEHVPRTDAVLSEAVRQTVIHTCDEMSLKLLALDTYPSESVGGAVASAAGKGGAQ